MISEVRWVPELRVPELRAQREISFVYSPGVFASCIWPWKELTYFAGDTGKLLRLLSHFLSFWIERFKP